MNKLGLTIPDWLLAGLLFVSTLFALAGVSTVPFHPDESTYLYMSGDLTEMFSHPLNLTWQNGQEITPQVRYRLLDAPLTRLIIGIGRLVAGQPALPADWNWSLTWGENRTAGALPSQELLMAGRTAITLLLPLSILFFYLAVRPAFGPWTTLLASLLLVFHPLVLLHARRAMAEGPLLLGVCLSLYALSRRPSVFWLLGVSLAVAFNAKHSNAALLPAAILSLYWTSRNKASPWAKLFYRAAGFAIIFLTITMLINPVLWRNPAATAREMLAARQDLVLRQTTDFTRVAPHLVLESPIERGLILAAQLFVGPPSIAETGNYQVETGPAAERYFSNPLHRRSGGLILGGFFAILALFGGVTAALDLRRPKPGRFSAGILLFTGLILFAGIVATVPLAFQRYALPLLPFASLLTAVGMARFIWMVRQGPRQVFPEPSISSEPG